MDLSDLSEAQQLAQGLMAQSQASAVSAPLGSPGDATASGNAASG
jgi:hypothetical protein